MISEALKILIAGESWVTHSIHIKGFDSFTTSSYEEGVGPLREALEGAGHSLTFQPNHVAMTQFPSTREELSKYNVVILSDIGANTLLLHPDVFARSATFPNRLEIVANYVRHGGGLIMVGGYLSFQGIEGKAAYHGTPVETVLPVQISNVDDRVEAPQGVIPKVVNVDHPAVTQTGTIWPALLGYNRLLPHPEAEVLVTCQHDPLVAVRMVDAGRSAVFASDCGPHWAPPTFLAWPGYRPLWRGLVSWVARQT